MNKFLVAIAAFGLVLAANLTAQQASACIPSITLEQNHVVVFPGQKKLELEVGGAQHISATIQFNIQSPILQVPQFDSAMFQLMKVETVQAGKALQYTFRVIGQGDAQIRFQAGPRALEQDISVKILPSPRGC